jgi:[1-hydroxy-2-(trimethylamino)ethyl]phosphonate dioxygenase
MDPRLEKIVRLFDATGDSRYGGEAVSQREHALQAAMFAQERASPPALIAAALLHDVGHLLHSLPEDAPDHGIDDLHEELGARWLEKFFGADVVEPVRLHVLTKRYLCAVDPAYRAKLSEPSLQSLALQGGPLNAEEARALEQHPHFHAAVQVRRWDEQAKVPALDTPPLEHFLPVLEQCLLNE